MSSRVGTIQRQGVGENQDRPAERKTICLLRYVLYMIHQVLMSLAVCCVASLIHLGTISCPVS
jgi:hypothetical protein